MSEDRPKYESGAPEVMYPAVVYNPTDRTFIIRFKTIDGLAETSKMTEDQAAHIGFAMLAQIHHNKIIDAGRGLDIAATARIMPGLLLADEASEWFEMSEEAITAIVADGKRWRELCEKSKGPSTG